MKPEIRELIERQNDGEILSHDEIKTLMEYCLELMQEFGRITDERITALKS
jgi:hypothetical protein